MESKTVQRRLAAILAADVVGYSRLMSTDEMGTLNTLKAHRRELIDPAIASHHGRIVKTLAMAHWSNLAVSSMQLGAPW
jgi:class 3 adenylate cyclase